MYPALCEGEFPVWHVHSACSWGSLPLAVPAGLCLYSWAPAWTMIPKAKQGKHLLLCSLSWLRDRLRFVCPTTDHVRNSWDWHVLRETHLICRLCSALTSAYLQAPLITYDWVVPITLEYSSWHTDWTCSQAEFLEAVCLLLTLWPRVSAMGWVMCEDSWKSHYKSRSSPFSRIRVFSWADPIHEGHYLSRQARQGRYLVHMSRPTLLLFSSSWVAC